VFVIATEKQFENKVKKFLQEQGCWFVKYWGGAVFTKSGIPDLLVCCNGYFLAIELKAPKGKPTDLQMWNIEQIRKAGGIGLILYPKDFNYLKELVQNLKGKG
jgi:Holliday junction resolvase